MSLPTFALPLTLFLAVPSPAQTVGWASVDNGAGALYHLVREQGAEGLARRGLHATWAGPGWDQVLTAKNRPGGRIRLPHDAVLSLEVPGSLVVTGEAVFTVENSQKRPVAKLTYSIQDPGTGAEPVGCLTLQDLGAQERTRLDLEPVDPVSLTGPSPEESGVCRVPPKPAVRGAQGRRPGRREGPREDAVGRRAPDRRRERPGMAFC